METPGEASVEVAAGEGVRIADTLRGIWDLRFSGMDIGLDDLPLQGVEMLLDVGPGGRSLRGFIDVGARLRARGEPRYRVLGELAAADARTVRWRLVPAGESAPSHELEAILDEVWGGWGMPVRAPSADASAASTGLWICPSRTVASSPSSVPSRGAAGHPTGAGAAGLAGLARAPAVPPALARHTGQVAPPRRRQARCAARCRLATRPARCRARRTGRRKHLNGSGEDFFFMHRHMLGQARALQPDLPNWTRLPLPSPYVEHDRLGFIRYQENRDGDSVPRPGGR